MESLYIIDYLLFVDGGWCDAISLSTCGPCGSGSAGTQEQQRYCNCSRPANGGTNCTQTPGSSVTFVGGVMTETFTANCVAAPCEDICTCSSPNCVGKLKINRQFSTLK